MSKGINLVLREKKEKRGISIAELSRRVDMDYEALRNVLEGDRQLKATELVSLCRELDVSLDELP